MQNYINTRYLQNIMKILSAVLVLRINRLVFCVEIKILSF